MVHSKRSTLSRRIPEPWVLGFQVRTGQRAGRSSALVLSGDAPRVVAPPPREASPPARATLSRVFSSAAWSPRFWCGASPPARATLSRVSSSAAWSPRSLCGASPPARATLSRVFSSAAWRPRFTCRASPPARATRWRVSASAEARPRLVFPEVPFSSMVHAPMPADMSVGHSTGVNGESYGYRCHIYFLIYFRDFNPVGAFLDPLRSIRWTEWSGGDVRPVRKKRGNSVVDQASRRQQRRRGPFPWHRRG